MSDWVKACATVDIDQGGCRVVDIDDVMIVIFNLDGEFYAIEDVCTHDGGELATGCVKGESIECPRHGAKFNIKTGAVETAPAYEPVDTFPIKIENGDVWVKDDRW